MPHFTQWYGVLCGKVQYPIPELEWDGPRDILSAGREVVAKSKVPVHGKKLLTRDMCHHSPYEFVWPGEEKGKYTLEQRCPWGPFPLVLLPADRSLLRRELQRSRGLYGDGNVRQPTLVPPNWAGTSQSERVLDSQDKSDDVAYLRLAIYGSPDAPPVAVRNPTDAADMAKYRQCCSLQFVRELNSTEPVAVHG
jgi:hypothetical protein